MLTASVSVPSYHDLERGDLMVSETAFCTALLILLLGLLAMRGFFMVRVRRSGRRIMPDMRAVVREGGHAVLIARVVLFFALTTALVMYFAGVAWVNEFSFSLPAGLRWASFGLGLISMVFWTWTQIHLDTRWFAQLQLQKSHYLVTTGPYIFMRHPLYPVLCRYLLMASSITLNVRGPN